MVTKTVNDSQLRISDESADRDLILDEAVEGTEIRIRIKGPLSYPFALAFEDELLAAACVCSNLELDLTDATSICAPSLETLLKVQKEMEKRPNAQLRLVRVSRAVLETLTRVGYDQILDIKY